MDNNLEISKMLTVSTIHIKLKTADMLSNDMLCMAVFKKDDYGWFIHVDTDDFEDSLKDLPEELAKVLKVAYEGGCEWLCLDCDGPEIEGLDKYDWNIKTDFFNRTKTINMDSGRFQTEFYTPSCPYGYADCISDPMYIKSTYPDWYKELGCPTGCPNCKDGNRYDNEDK